MLTEIIFWSSFLFIFYTYAGYPLVLLFWSLFSSKEAKKGELSELPMVSILIAAKNEEINIGRRIDNLCEQDYPEEKMEIVIVSDGSTDETNKIVRNYEKQSSASAKKKGSGPAIKLVTVKESSGKANALNEGMQHVKGDIVVFADARQVFEPNVVTELIANFADSEVGCVSGELFFSDKAESSMTETLGLYWTLEKFIRKKESLIDSVVGATGAIYAIRKVLYKDLPSGTLLDDVLTPMNSVMQGYRTVFDGSACAYDIISTDSGHEWRRKVRTLAGNWQLMSLKPRLLFPSTNPVWLQFISHKVFRLLVPFVLPVLLISSLLGGHWLFAFLQVIFYVFALSGWLVPSLRSFRFVNISYFFVLLNIAVLVGCLYWVRGDFGNVWKSSNGSE